MPRRQASGTRPSLRVRLLGGFEVDVSGRPVQPGSWRLGKAADLVKLLALTPGHRLHREQAMELLWPDKEPEAAANNLYQAIHAARKALGRGVAGPLATVQLRDGILALDPGADVWVDVEAFESDVARARAGDRAAEVTARTLYIGELLPEDRYEDWAAARRESLGEAWRGLLTDLGTRLEAEGDLPGALGRVRELVALDPLDEDAHRRLMRLEIRSGDRAAALQAYETLRNALRRDLDVDPGEETEALRRDIIDGRLAAPGERSWKRLPVQLTSFIGRDREQREVERLLGATRLLTLTGPGGSGKTRLAVQVAGALADMYPGGVRFVELASVGEPAGVVRAVSDSLGLREAPGVQLMDLVVEEIRQVRLLLVLDNCEHLVEACADLATALLACCQNVRILATSRQALRVPGESLFRVPSLQVPDPDAAPEVGELGVVDAVRLFVERAKAVDPSFNLTADNAASVAIVCYHLDGLPLAIELAASRVASIPLGVLAERLPERFELLVGGHRTALTRQQTLKATLDWSYQLLTPEQARVLRRLSIFSGGPTPSGAEAVCADLVTEPGEILAILGDVVDQSLLALDEGSDRPRYRMLETVREYARDRSKESGEQRADESAHLAWLLQLAAPAAAGTAGRGWLNAFRLLDPELGNLRAALERALGTNPRAALELAASLYQYWLWDGHLAEGRSWLERALDSIPERTELRARALRGLAAILARSGLPDAQISRTEEALSISEELGDRIGACWAIQLLGVGCWSTDDLPGAEAYLQRAIEVATASGFGAGLTAALNALAVVRLFQRRPGEALRLIDQGLAELGRQPGEGRDDAILPPTLDLGFEVLRLEPSTGGLRLTMEETAATHGGTAASAAIGYLLGNRGMLARLGGDPEAARANYEAALQQFETIADQRGIAYALARLGMLAVDEGDLDARPFLEQSLAIRRATDDARGVNMAQVNLARLELLAGRFDAASALLTESADACRRRSDRWLLTATLSDLASLALARGDATAAHLILEESLAVARVIGRRRQVGWTELQLAAVARIEGSAEEADRHAGLAAEIFRDIDDQTGLAQVAALLMPATGAARIKPAQRSRRVPSAN